MRNMSGQKNRGVVKSGERLSPMEGKGEVTKRRGGGKRQHNNLGWRKEKKRVEPEIFTSPCITHGVQILLHPDLVQERK